MITKIIETLSFAFFGVFASSLIHQSKKIKWRELIGYPILITLLSMFLSNRIKSLNKETIWGLVGIIGYLLGVFKDKGLLRIIKKTADKTKDITTSIIESMEEEL